MPKKQTPEQKSAASKQVFLRKLYPAINHFQRTDAEALAKSFINHLEFSLAKDEYSATQRDLFKSLALTVKDRLIERWIETQQSYYRQDAKRIYYLSMEFLIGRLLGDNLINLGLYENANKALQELGLDLQKLRDLEEDAGLGNGGLGRLAACFLDSMATLELPAYGYGIRYEYGIFSQRIKNGYQLETPDSWLRYGNPWEIERPEYIYIVKFYGKVVQSKDEKGQPCSEWIDTEDIVAMAYDTPIPGYLNNTVNNLRLWAAKSTREFNLEYFNHGNYEQAVGDKIESETISKVLYPRDDFIEGRELRLKQEYFLVSATLQDIIRRYKKAHNDQFKSFADKVAIQLNDTHPVLAIPELMRILVDTEGIAWDKAWDITVKTFGYTNHTVLPEALEVWRVKLLEQVLPRHLQIIYEINLRFLESVSKLYPNESERLRHMSLIEEGMDRKVRMANLGIVGSHSVNGVAALHTEILKTRVFKDFYDLWPEKFNNKTNGISQRTWLRLCNAQLARLISDTIDEQWVTNLSELKKIKTYCEKQDFQKKWTEIKHNNKIQLANYVQDKLCIEVDPDSLFDCHIKRFHEYKRQLLNLLHVITLYHRIKNSKKKSILPRTVFFSGKAAPAYDMAKLIIKLINSVAEMVNNDPDINNRLKVIFLPNYSVSLAQVIIPAAELSEQISTAGMEASGTGNMKFSLNGALTIGTLDGANIEIQEEVGKENIFIFGLTAEEVTHLRQSGYNPWNFYNADPELKQVLDLINEGYFSKDEPQLFRPIVESLLYKGDYFMLLADYRAYLDCQARVEETYRNRNLWNKISILTVANMGKFSSDRTIAEYAKEIWKVKPVKIQLGKKK